MIDANIAKLNPKTRRQGTITATRAAVPGCDPPYTSELAGRASQRDADKGQFESRERRAETLPLHAV